MRTVFTMWRNTRLIILSAVCAAIYGAALIAFKTAIPFIPGITELRVANIFPMVFGLLFGPAGAWGTAFGNLIGDLFGGTLGPGSIAGFVGNFLLGYLPYAMWNRLIPCSDLEGGWKKESWQSWTNYFFIAFISSAACAVVISTFIDTLGIVPYPVLSKIITLNNTFASWIGSILLVSVFRVVKEQLGLFWLDLVDESEKGKPLAPTVGSWLITLASLSGLVASALSGPSLLTTAWICTGMILLGSFLL